MKDGLIQATTLNEVVEKTESRIAGIKRRRGYSSPTLNNFTENILREVKDEGDTIYDFAAGLEIDEDGVKAVFNSMTSELLAELGLKRI